MSRAGSCHDNAVAESWFATLKTELIYRIAVTGKAFARRRVIAWIDRYNRTRRHSHCGLKSPVTGNDLRFARGAWAGLSSWGETVDGAAAGLDQTAVV